MLVVEDGTGKQDANAYVDLAFADAFFRDRGLDDELLVLKQSDIPETQVWIGRPEMREAALIRATDHIDATYGAHFLGARKTTDQGLCFPRTTVSPLIPIQLKKATALYAIRALQGRLVPDPDPVTQPTSQTVLAAGAVVRKTKKVGPVEDTTEYSEGAGGSRDRVVYFHEVISPRSYPEADMMLQTLLKPEAIVSPSHGKTQPSSTEVFGVYGVGTTMR